MNCSIKRLLTSVLSTVYRPTYKYISLKTIRNKSDFKEKFRRKFVHGSPLCTCSVRTTRLVISFSNQGVGLRKVQSFNRCRSVGHCTGKNPRIIHGRKFII